MSKKLTKLYILLGVLAVVCLGIWGVSRYEEHRDTVKAEQQQILSVEKDNIKKVSWTIDNKTLSFYKDDSGTWLYSGDDKFPVDQDKVNDCLSLLEDFGSSFIIENVEDYSQYGLEDSTNVIRFSTDDKDYSITLGDFSSLDEKRYVSIDDGKVYLANDDPQDTFDKTLEQMIKNDDIPSFDDVDEVEFSGNYSYHIQHLDQQKSICEDDEYFVRESSTYKPVDTSRLNSYLSSVKNVSLDTYVTYDVSDEELTQYGLDAPELTATISYKGSDDEDDAETNEIFIFSVSENPDELAQKKAQDEEAESSGEVIDDDEKITVTKYLRINESSIIYEISSSDYDSLMAGSYDDLRHQELFTADFDTATSIDITLDGESYTLTYGKPVQEEDDESADKSKDKEAESEDDKWYYGSEEIDISGIKSKLKALSADSFTNDASDGKEEISITVHLDNEDYSSISITLYRHDGDLCLAKVNNVSEAYVSRQSVVNLIEAVNAVVL